jgi:hypothetical protein
MRAADPLDTSVPVALDDEFKAPWFDWLAEKWPDRGTARQCLTVVHRMDVERAAQQPVINVTVPGVAGHFTGTLGGGEVAYVPDQALTGAFAALPDSLT